MLSSVKIKETLASASSFIAIWLVISYFLYNENYSSLALFAAALWIFADGICDYFFGRGVAEFGAIKKAANSKERRNNISFFNYSIEGLILIYIFIQYYYFNITQEHLVWIVFLYSLLQRLLNFVFENQPSSLFDKLRLEEELDKELGLLLAIALMQIWYIKIDNPSFSNIDSSFLALLVAMSLYSLFKAFLESQNKDNKITKLDEPKDNGTLGLSLKDFCSREARDEYQQIADDSNAGTGCKAIANLKLASIFHKMGLYKNQNTYLEKYREITAESVYAEKTAKEFWNIVKVENTSCLLVKADIIRMVTNFEQDFKECKANVINLKSKPITGFLAIFKIFLGILVILFSLHFFKIINIMNAEPGVAGPIGIGLASLFIIFKDFIFAIFSGLRIYTDNLFSVGDKLQIDEFNITGKVINFNPSTVEIRSTDNSVTKIYMHKVVGTTFKNLAHRKKRGRYLNLTLNIDANSIVNLSSDSELYVSLNKVFLLKRFLKCKEDSIKSFNTPDCTTRGEFMDGIKTDYYKPENKNFEEDKMLTLNKRNLTNIGVFREYVFRYLSNHNLIDNDQYIMARQLEPKDTGVSIEIKAYTEVQYSNKRDYERIYSDIVEHLLISLPEFKLVLFHAESSSGRKIELS